jgi:hypothetical protein
VDQTGAYPILVPLYVNLQARLEGLPGRSTLAYREDSKITAVKSFITLSQNCSLFEIGHDRRTKGKNNFSIDNFYVKPEAIFLNLRWI